MLYVVCARPFILTELPKTIHVLPSHLIVEPVFTSLPLTLYWRVKVFCGHEGVNADGAMAGRAAVAHTAAAATDRPAHAEATVCDRQRDREEETNRRDIVNWNNGLVSGRDTKERFGQVNISTNPECATCHWRQTRR